MTDRSRFRNSGGFGGRGGRGRGGRGRGRGGGRQDRTTPRGGGRSGNPRAGNPTETRGRGRGRGGRGGQGGQGRPAPNNPASARFSRRPVGTQVSGKQSILQEIAKASDLKVNAKDVQPAYELLCKKYNPDKELFKEPEMQSLSFIIPTMVKATDAYEQAFRSGKPITQDRFREYKAQFVQLLFMKFAPGENITQEYQEKRAKVCTCLIQICGKLQDFRNANRYAKMWLSKLAPWVEITSRDDASLSQSFNLMIVQTYVNPFVKHVASTALKSLPRGRAAVSIRRASAQIDNLLFAYAYAEFDRWSKETDPTAFKPLPVSFKRLQDEFVKVAKCLRQLHLREAKELPATKPKEQEPKEPTVENKMLVPPGSEDKTGSKDSKVTEGPKAPRQNFLLWALKKPADLEVEKEKKRQAAQEARKKKIQDAKDAKIAALKNAGRKPVEEVVAVSHKAGDWVKANEKGEIVLLKAFESKHAGKLLFTEAPLVVKFNRGAGRHCANCYRVNRSARAVKCAKYEKCRVMFCGSKCAEAALTNGRHGMSLCGDKYHGQSLDRHSHLILQLISMSGGLNNFVTKFQSVFDAKVNAQAKLVDLLGSIIVKWTLKTLKTGQSQDDLPINNSVLIDTYQLIKTLEKSAPEEAPVNVPENGVKLLYKMLVFLRNFPQSQISIQGRAAGRKRGKGRKVSQNQNGKPTKDRAKSVPLGTALGSIGGLMAFSCDPVLKRSLNTATGLIEYRVIRANAKLEEGKVLTVSYGLQGSKGRKRGGQGGQTFQQQRKQDIEKRFGIVCTCTVCSTVGAAGGGSTLAGTSPSTSTGGSFQSANISPRSSLY